MDARTIGAVLGASALLLIAGCAGTAGGSAAGWPPATPELPTGEVSAVGMVLEKDGTPMLCRGPIAESYPPQCSGPVIVGWDWGSVEGEESASGVTWGSYAVWGTWDGNTFTVTREPLLAALYDPMVDPSAPDLLDEGRAPGAIPESESERVWAELKAALPDVVSLFFANGRVEVEVLFDDGTLQAAVDERYGDDAVIVTSSFTPVAER